METVKQIRKALLIKKNSFFCTYLFLVIYSRAVKMDKSQKELTTNSALN